MNRLDRLSVSVLLASGLAAQQDSEAAPVADLVDAFPSQETFDRPVFLAHDPSDPDHYWVLEQGGKVLRVPRDPEASERTELLDLPEVALHPSNGGHNEEGLLGFAFDPEFAESRHVYLYYSHKLSGFAGRRIRRESVVSRMTVRDGIAGPLIDSASELALMRLDQPFGNHNGGTIVFGPDGMLYVALGDGGAGDDILQNGQNKGTLLAAILRIDVRGASPERPYAIPPDNPFVGEDGSRGEIWAYGLRNPWRISFDSKTGDLWCGDVGQNRFEEVDRIEKGGNYGWSLREGLHEFPPGRDDASDPPGMIAPIVEYPRQDGISVTGGYVYRGRALPRLAGRFVYADYVMRTIWAVREDGTGKGRHDVLVVGRAPAPPASFAEEPDGELLVLCFDGRIYRLSPPGE